MSRRDPRYAQLYANDRTPDIHGLDDLCQKLQEEKDGLRTRLVDLLAERDALLTAVSACRLGAPQVIGYDRDGEAQRAFVYGWNSALTRVWQRVPEASKAFVPADGTAADRDDSPRITDGEDNCDDAGTGEGRYHGRM